MKNESGSQEGILIVDFGSQYSRLIARRVRELNTYCEIVNPSSTIDDMGQINIKGVILSGGPSSVYDEDSPEIPKWVKQLNVPVLGICYGMQAMVYESGGSVEKSSKREFGNSVIKKVMEHPILKGIDNKSEVWMSHSDKVINLPEKFETIAKSENSENSIISNGDNFIGIQFHPEVSHTKIGPYMIRNFITEICSCNDDWVPQKFVEEAISEIRNKVKEGKVICALSGGVDSSVAAMLIHKAIGKNLKCIFVDNGLLRKNEPEKINEIFTSKLGDSFKFIDASKEFISALKDISDPEQKRKIIGSKFIEIFDRNADEIGAEFLAQGTLYSDVVESKAPGMKSSHKIKSHHNVGGLPENMKLELVEPLRFMFKDEVRMAGIELGIEKELVNRHPFPGPGLSIRIIGSVTEKKLGILREADSIVVEEIKKSNQYEKLWQAFAVLTNTKTVGVMGDKRTYNYAIALRFVESIDAMTADVPDIPMSLLKNISTRIVNEVSEVNRVVYDITSKPPGTIEWE